MLTFDSEGVGDNAFKIEKVAEGIHLLRGMGGNVVLAEDSQSALLIDNQLAAGAEKLRAELANLTDKPLEWLVNTHWHEDHTGGNHALAARSCLSIAHENTRRRLADGMNYQFVDYAVAPACPSSLPKLTFSSCLDLHLDSGVVHLRHVPNAHTDGDITVHFRQANVMQLADIYFNGCYPIIDFESGGTLKGVINAVNGVLDIVDAQTVLIPGHGPSSNMDELEAYLNMLLSTYEKVTALKSRGLSVEEVVNARPSAQFDDEWGKGFLTPDNWIRMVYQTI